MKDDKISKKYVKEMLEDLIFQGRCLASIAYEMKQRKEVPKDMRGVCEQYQKQWDLALSKLPKWME